MDNPYQHVFILTISLLVVGHTCQKQYGIRKNIANFNTTPSTIANDDKKASIPDLGSQNADDSCKKGKQPHEQPDTLDDKVKFNVLIAIVDELIDLWTDHTPKSQARDSRLTKGDLQTFFTRLVQKSVVCSPRGKMLDIAHGIAPKIEEKISQMTTIRQQGPIPQFELEPNLRSLIDQRKVCLNANGAINPLKQYYHDLSYTTRSVPPNFITKQEHLCSCLTSILVQAVKNRYDRPNVSLKLTSLLKEGVDLVSDRYRIKMHGLHLIYLQPKKAKNHEKDIAEVHLKMDKPYAIPKDYPKSYQWIIKLENDEQILQSTKDRSRSHQRCDKTVPT